jgi:hypothetical protein
MAENQSTLPETETTTATRNRRSTDHYDKVIETTITAKNADEVYSECSKAMEFHTARGETAKAKLEDAVARLAKFKDKRRAALKIVAENDK